MNDNELIEHLDAVLIALNNTFGYTPIPDDLFEDLSAIYTKLMGYRAILKHDFPWCNTE